MPIAYTIRRRGRDCIIYFRTECSLNHGHHVLEPFGRLNSYSVFPAFYIIADIPFIILLFDFQWHLSKQLRKHTFNYISIDTQQNIVFYNISNSYRFESTPNLRNFIHNELFLSIPPKQIWYRYNDLHYSWWAVIFLWEYLPRKSAETESNSRPQMRLVYYHHR